MADVAATKASQGKTPTKVKGRSPEETLQAQSLNPHNRILSLQKATGNRAVGRLLQSDSSRESTSITNLPSAAQSVLEHSEGQPLDTTTRVEMESHFNHNFSAVRVHSDAITEKSTRELNANAYTFGRDIVFAPGQFAPHTTEGKHLLAHELAHVVQQQRGGSSPSIVADAPHERSADAAAADVAAGKMSVSVVGATGVGIARAPKDDERKRRDRAIREQKMRDLQRGDREFDDIRDDDRVGSRNRDEQRTAGRKSARQLEKSELEGELSSAGKAARKLREAEAIALSPSGHKRSHKSKERLMDQVEQAHKILNETVAPIDESKRKAFVVHQVKQKGKIDEAMRTSQRSGVKLQQKYVAGTIATPQHDLPPGRSKYSQPDQSEGNLHTNLKSDKIHKMTIQGAVTRIKEHAEQAKKNVTRDLPEGHTIKLNYLRTPSKAYQEAMLKEAFKPGNGISVVQFGTTVHKNPDPNPGAPAPTPEKPEDDPKPKHGRKKGKGSPSHTKTPKVKKADALKPAKPPASGKTSSKQTASKPPTTGKTSSKKTLTIPPAVGKTAPITPTATSLAPAKAKTTTVSPTPKPPAPAAKAAPVSLAPKPHTANKTSSKQTAPKPSAVGRTAPITPTATSLIPAQAKTTTVSPTPKNPAPAPTTKSPVPVAVNQTPVSPAPKPPTPAAQTAPVIPVGGSPTLKPPTTGKSAPAASPAAKSAAQKQSVPSPPKTQDKGPIVNPQPLPGGKGDRPPATRRGPTIQTAARSDGSITANVSQIPGTAPTRYAVTVRVMLGGTLSASATQSGKNGQIGANASVSGSVTWSNTYEFSEQEKNAYLAAVNGNTASSYQEIAAANLWAKGSQVQAKALLEQLGGQSPGADQILRLREGESQDFSAEARVQGGVSGSAKAVSLGASGSASVQNGWAIARRQGRFFITRSFTVEKGKVLEGDVSIGLLSMGYAADSGTTQSTSISFVVKEDDPDAKTKLATITAVGSIEDLGRLALNRKDLGGSVTATKGTSSGGTLRVGAGNSAVSLEGQQQSSKTNSSTRDAQGNVTNTYVGGTNSGLRLKIKGHDVANVHDRSSIRTDVKQDGTATGETLVEKTESDLTASAKQIASHPLASVQALYKGDTQALLKTTTVKSGANLENDNYSRLAEQAQDVRAWREAGIGFGTENLVAWMKLRSAVAHAGGNRTVIAKLLQDFNSEGDDHRRRIVERASDIGSGNRFEFPDVIKDQKEVFDSLVVNNPMNYASELAAAGKTAEALAELKSVGSRLDALSGAINAHAGEILSTILPDMNNRITKRKTQVRAEINKLAPSPAATAQKPGALIPEAVDDAAKRDADRKAQIDGEIQSLIAALQGNRLNENAKFAEVEALFREGIHRVPLTNQEVRLSNPSLSDILPKLGNIRMGYEKWDQQIEALKAHYRERNENPEQANQFAPNRAKWNELNTRKE